MKETSKRPYFSGEFDERLLGKKRRLTSEQVNMLEKSFKEENKLEQERKIELAKNLGLPQRQEAVWFQNRKARCKVKNIERDYDIVKACYDSLLAKHELVISENEVLKSKVLTLTEKLNQTQRYFQDKFVNSRVDETMSASTALIPFANEDYLTNMSMIDESSLSWWVRPSNLVLKSENTRSVYRTRDLVFQAFVLNMGKAWIVF